MIRKQLQYFGLAFVAVIAVLFVIFQLNRERLVTPSETMEGTIVQWDAKSFTLEQSSRTRIKFQSVSQIRYYDADENALDRVSVGDEVVVGYFLQEDTYYAVVVVQKPKP
ncbi:MAG: hypothetical protein ACRDBX_07050 [Erysipelotrichaceae bacterium]